MCEHLSFYVNSIPPSFFFHNKDYKTNVPHWHSLFIFQAKNKLTMKKILYALVVLLIAAFIMPSCNSSLSITKRRYTKGYYVHHNHGKKHLQTNKQSDISGKFATTSTEAVRNVEYTLPVQKEKTPERILTASAADITLSDLKKNPAAAKKQVAELAIKKPVKALKLATQAVNAADPAGEALSLLWVVIVVILIVYLLGLLFNGFGLPSGLIHILGVIALVLLILWLLRIL